MPAIGVEARQVFDLPERLIEVTEHQVAIYACAHCRCETRAAFPAEVGAPARDGERLRAAAVYLNVQQLIPEDRVAQTLSDLFGAVHFCPDTLADWVEKKARAFEAEFFTRIAALASAAPVRCLDETGFRVAGRGHWLHTVATDTLTLYRVSPKRGDIPKDLIGGVIVHDGFKSYGRLKASATRSATPITCAGIVNLSVRWAEGRRFFSEVRSGRSACLGDLAPNPEGALARSAAAVGSDGFGIGNVEEIRHLIVNR